MPVTAPWNAGHGEGVGAPPGITGPPWFARKAVPAGDTMTCVFLNLTQWIWVYSTRAAQISVHAGGVVATSFIDIPAGLPFAMPAQCERLLVTIPGGAAAVVSVAAVLGKEKGAAPFNEAIGFDGVESLFSVTVA